MRTIRLLILIVAVFGTTILRAQAPLLPVTSVVTSRAEATTETDTRAVRLLVGRSTLVDVATPITRVSLTSPDVADALVTSPNQLLINGKMPGTISMFVWDRSGGIRRFEVIVQRDLARLTEQFKQLFPGETIDAQSNGKDVVLSGIVSGKDVIEKAINVAAGYVEKKEEVVTLLQIRETGASNQVLLRVRFAEVSRSAMTALGASLFTGANGYKDLVARSTSGTAAPSFDTNNGGLVFSDFLNLFLFDTKHQLGTVIQALQSKGLFQSLAEPNLVAESGKEASFLAGGEIPIPIAQGTGGATTISVQYKEFGVRLNFTPVVTGNRVHLKVRPEVSTLDFTNAVVLNGFRIPALSTRRTETEVELENGQTFAIAGLMNNTVNSTMQKIPGIGDIPILGMLFKSKSAQKNLTELVVMITPEILPKNSNGVTSTLPRVPEKFLPSFTPKESVEMPPPAFRQGSASVSGPATDAVTAAAPVPPSSAKPARPSAKEAAATMSGPSAASRPVIQATSAPKAATESSAVGSRPLSPEEKSVLARAHKQENAAKAAAAKQAAATMEIDRQNQKKEDVRVAKLAHEQAKRDAEAARLAAEQAKRQAEIDKKQQKVTSDAEARVKAAEAAYQSELAKSRKQ
jgi:pilus assembly protein CpaC